MLMRFVIISFLSILLDVVLRYIFIALYIANTDHISRYYDYENHLSPQNEINGNIDSYSLNNMQIFIVIFHEITQ